MAGKNYVLSEKGRVDAYGEIYEGGAMLDCLIGFDERYIKKRGWNELRKTAVECFLGTLEKSGICDMAKGNTKSESDREYQKFKNHIKNYGDKNDNNPKLQSKTGMFICLYLGDDGYAHPNINFATHLADGYYLDLKEDLADLEFSERKKILETFEKIFFREVKKREKELIGSDI